MHRTLNCLAALVLALLLLAGCAPRTGSVSAEELAQLRETYPVDNAFLALSQSTKTNDEVWPTFQDLAYYNDFYAVAILEMKGDWYTVTNTGVKMYDDDRLNNTIPGANRGLKWEAHDAVVQEILWGGEELEAGDTVTLGFGDVIVTAGDFLSRTYVPGGRYICFLAERDELGFNIEHFYATAKPVSYYLTDQDVVLSIMDFAGAEECSGLYLRTFEERLLETMNAPERAELYPEDE